MNRGEGSGGGWGGREWGSRRRGRGRGSVRQGRCKEFTPGILPSIPL